MAFGFAEELKAENERLRLTDAEREALDGIISDFSEIADFNEERCYPVYANKARRRAAILRGLLDRTQPDARLAALERLVALDQELEERP